MFYLHTCVRFQPWNTKIKKFYHLVVGNTMHVKQACMKNCFNTSANIFKAPAPPSPLPKIYWSIPNWVYIVGDSPIWGQSSWEMHLPSYHTGFSMGHSHFPTTHIAGHGLGMPTFSHVVRHESCFPHSVHIWPPLHWPGSKKHKVIHPSIDQAIVNKQAFAEK